MVLPYFAEMDRRGLPCVLLIAIPALILLILWIYQMIGTRSIFEGTVIFYVNLYVGFLFAFVVFGVLFLILLVLFGSPKKKEQDKRGKAKKSDSARMRRR